MFMPQVREKYLSLRKNTRNDVAAALEEVLSIGFFKLNGFVFGCFH